MAGRYTHAIVSRYGENSLENHPNRWSAIVWIDRETWICDFASKMYRNSVRQLTVLGRTMQWHWINWNKRFINLTTSKLEYKRNCKLLVQIEFSEIWLRIWLVFHCRIPVSLRTRGEIDLEEAKRQHESYVRWENAIYGLSLSLER